MDTGWKVEFLNESVEVPGKRVIILRTFVKKTRKTPKREIEIALQRIKELDHG